MSTESERADRSLRERWLTWPSGSLVTLCLASVVVTVAGGLVQVSFGTFEMPILEAWRTVFAADVLFDRATWEWTLLGEAPPGLSARETIVWDIRLPRVLLAALVGTNLAVSGAVF